MPVYPGARTVPSIPVFLRAPLAAALHGQVESLARKRSKVTERRAQDDDGNARERHIALEIRN
jgi:hypothetical protein